MNQLVKSLYWLNWSTGNHEQSCLVEISPIMQAKIDVLVRSGVLLYDGKYLIYGSVDLQIRYNGKPELLVIPRAIAPNAVIDPKDFDHILDYNIQQVLALSERYQAALADYASIQARRAAKNYNNAAQALLMRELEARCQHNAVLRNREEIKWRIQQRRLARQKASQ